MESHLHAALPRRVDPAHGNPIDANALKPVSLRGVAGEQRQRRLRGGIERRRRTAAMNVHRQNVHDGAAIMARHRLYTMAHEEKRRALIHPIETVIGLGVGLSHRGPIRQRR